MALRKMREHPDPERPRPARIVVSTRFRALLELVGETGGVIETRAYAPSTPGNFEEAIRQLRSLAEELGFETVEEPRSMVPIQAYRHAS